MTVRFDFASDNVAGMAPEALAALTRHNAGYARAYGGDEPARMAADLIRQRFEKACRRLGLNRQRERLDLSLFRPPGQPGQMPLF